MYVLRIREKKLKLNPVHVVFLVLESKGLFCLQRNGREEPVQGFQVAETVQKQAKRKYVRAVSLFSWSVEQNARDTQMTTRVTEGARRAAVLASHVSRLRRSTLARACTPLTKSEEKERLLAV